MSSSPDTPELKPIVSVLVLYRLAPAASETLRTLLSALAVHPELAPQLTLLIYDNSPAAQPVPPLPVEHVYHSDPANPGLAAAYNAGLQLAAEQGAPWLMLLDQDTALTPEYLAQAFTLTRTAGADVAALVPRLSQAGHIHSPHRLPHLSHRPLPDGLTGTVAEEISAFNSAALVRVSAVQAIGGFPTEFPLDFLDHALFARLQHAGERLYILPATLRHDLSTTRLGGDASLARYRKVLEAERRFYAQPGVSGHAWYRLRRLKQTAGHLVKVADKRFAWWDLRAAFGLL